MGQLQRVQLALIITLEISWLERLRYKVSRGSPLDVARAIISVSEDNGIKIQYSIISEGVDE